MKKILLAFFLLTSSLVFSQTTTRYFHVSVMFNRGTFPNLSSLTQSLTFKSDYGFFSCADVQKYFVDSLKANPQGVVITNIYEFKSKKDWQDFNKK